MGIFDILGPPKEKRTQLQFRDDGKFTFRKLDVEDTFLQLKRNKIAFKGWKHFYKLQFPFVGLRKIASDMVTLSYDRDIILDPYDIIDVKDKPSVKKSLNENDWVTDVAESQRYKAQNKPRNVLLVDKITLILGACVFMNIMAMAIRAAWS